MAIAITLQEYLDKSGIEYEVMPHIPTASSSNTAEAAHVPGDDLAKSVVLEDERGFLMAVVPATHHVELDKLSRQLDRRLSLVSEQKISKMFDDCDIGAIPPVGEAYHLDVVVDDSLNDRADVYFEAGDHEDIVHVRGQDFQQLMQHARHGYFSRRI